MKEAWFTMSEEEFKILAKKHNGLCTFFQICTIIAGIFAILISVYNQIMILNQPMHGLAYCLVALIVTVLVCYILKKLKYKSSWELLGHFHIWNWNVKQNSHFYTCSIIAFQFDKFLLFPNDILNLRVNPNGWICPFLSSSIWHPIPWYAKLRVSKFYHHTFP